jgi:maltose/moltooligosaccharide transporter
LHNDRVLAVQIGGGLFILAALLCYFLIKEEKK